LGALVPPSGIPADPAGGHAAPGQPGAPPRSETSAKKNRPLRCLRVPARVLHCGVAAGERPGSHAGVVRQGPGGRQPVVDNHNREGLKAVLRQNTSNERARRRSSTRGAAPSTAAAGHAASSIERWAMDVAQVTLGLDDWAHLAALIGFGDPAVARRESRLLSHARGADQAPASLCRNLRGSRPPSGRPRKPVTAARPLRAHSPARPRPVLHPGQSSTLSARPALNTCREERVRATLGHAPGGKP
jgi:hypothetical protein